MTDDQRYTEPLDVDLIAVRDGATGPEVLLSRRAGEMYAAGCWHLVSGHLDGPWEDVVTALVRETREESGIVVDPVDVRAAVTVHHRSPVGGARLGMFFEVKRWQGIPEVMKHRVCDAMGWFPFDNLPEPMVAYCRAGLDAYRAGARMAVHFQEPGDPIAYDPDIDRTVLVPAPAAEKTSRRGRVPSPSRRWVGSPPGRTSPGRARKAAYGGYAPPRAAPGTSRSTRTIYRFHQREVTACVRLPPAWARPRPGWWQPMRGCGR
ncbi:NUDIX domain-containing protein [Streptomyces sp. NPDC021012]|uniref:NUDIX hydrolase n=1 Tax=Streptomyces sp. NPDC021012 TaxID=3365107 RepID=UPI0037BD76F0